MKVGVLFISAEDEVFIRAVELGCQPAWAPRAHMWVCLCKDSRHTSTPERPVLSWSALNHMETEDGA
jgi:hypothetical protein